MLLTPTIFTLHYKILHNTLIHGHFQHQVKHCQSKRSSRIKPPQKEEKRYIKSNTNNSPLMVSLNCPSFESHHYIYYLKYFKQRRKEKNHIF